MRKNSIPFSAVSAANAAGVATVVNTDSNHRLRLQFLVVSYSAAPTGGVVTITDGKNVNWTVDVPSTTPVVLPALNLQTAPGVNLVITLAAAGAGVVGHVNGYAEYE